MSHSYLKNQVSLKDFTPPRGTTKVVELSLIERKNIGRRRLAEHVARLFAADPTRVTIRSFGRYITIANIGWGFQVSSRSGRHSPPREKGFRNFQEFVEYLGSGGFAPTELLRMAKLIRQRENDQRSLKGSKKMSWKITVLPILP